MLKWQGYFSADQSVQIVVAQQQKTTNLLLLVEKSFKKASIASATQKPGQKTKIVGLPAP